MKITESKVMRGPNYWSSVHKHLIVIKIEVNELSRDQIAEFIHGVIRAFNVTLNGLENYTMPGLATAIKFMAAELQAMAGMPCDFSMLRQISNNEFYLIYCYESEEMGLRAGESAMAIASDILNNKTPDINAEVKELSRLQKKHRMGATSYYLLNEVKSRGIPFRRHGNSSLVTLGYGTKQRQIRTAVCSTTSGLGIEIAADKEETKSILAQSHIPVPAGILVYSEFELRNRLTEVNFPLVIKPLDGNHGRGVTTRISDIESAVFGFNLAKRVSDAIVVEEFIEGDDYRFLVINYKLVAVAKRKPAFITGNGSSTIRELIDEENKNPERGDGDEHVLALIKIDEITKMILLKNDLTTESVLKRGEKLVLKDTSNISAGGTAEDVTNMVHPENKFMAERIARILNLDICGVDIMAKAIDAPLTRKNGAVIEVNAGPGLRMHSNPQEGSVRNVAAPIIDMLFPTQDFKIPLIAVTGTNGKTTVTRLIAHLAGYAGFKPGYTTTDGIYIDGHKIFEGDCTGFVSSEDVLFDPLVNFAVLECARGGILRSGLAFDECDIGIVTNVTEDHLGLKDIQTLEEMARVKQVVPLAAKNNGYAILNADDDLVFGMHKNLSCHVALFSLDKENERIRRHCREGGLAAVIEEGWLKIYEGDSVTEIEEVNRIPLSLDGRAESMIKNLLPAVLAAFISGFKMEKIREGLSTFIPSPRFTPGRMNIFKFRDFEFMLDYAHNIDGYLELNKFLKRTDAAKKVGIISVAGDRKNSDIVKIGSIAAETFDEIIIRHDKDMRGRPKEEMTALLTEGIRKVSKNKPVKVISDEIEAIEQAIHHAVRDAFIVVCSEQVNKSIDFLTNALNRNLIREKEKA